MNRSRPLAAGGVTALLALSLAGSALAAPAVDEYGANLPTAKGQKSQGTGIPQAHPEDLPPSVTKSLDSSPDAKKLKALATAPQLGAPQTKVTGTPGAANDSGDESFVGAAAGALGSPWVLLLILGLGLGVGGAWWARRDSTA